MAAPEFDGKCAFALSLGPAGKAPAGKAQHALEVDGKTYYFVGAVPKLLFRLIPGSRERAERRWAAG
ncbi:hypothetical protein [Amycolatopsis circi]|uniref:hypothetical protein n=1 Tax=Amycolatopsis circi TaxID=871959 RepID=UPI000E2479ED|nr:hypothetical protein [Amycolatopsis circi]